MVNVYLRDPIDNSVNIGVVYNLFHGKENLNPCLLFLRMEPIGSISIAQVNVESDKDENIDYLARQWYKL